MRHKSSLQLYGETQSALAYSHVKVIASIIEGPHLSEEIFSFVLHSSS